MDKSYTKLLNEAESKKGEYAKLAKKIKKVKPNTLDEQVHTLHDEAFEEIDCLSCANCCSTTSPLFKDNDINRLAKALKIKPSKFIEQYLMLDNEGDYVFKSAPCPFLGEDNYCSVYNNRPKACKEYPHTNRKKFYQIINLSLKNTRICPAVARVFSELNKRY